MQIKTLITTSGKVLIASSIFALVACGSTADRAAPDLENSKKLDADGASGARIDKLVRQKRQENPLDIPPDIVGDTDPKLIDKLETQRREQESRQVVLPEVVKARIVTDDKQQEYVEVDATADVVWNRLLEYWAEEGVVMTRAEPKKGLMETEWIENLDELEEETGPTRFLKEAFNRITGKGIENDKYRLQLARDNGKTRVYVSHRSTVREAADRGSKKITDFEWVQKEADPLKVREMMQVVVLLFEGVE